MNSLRKSTTNESKTSIILNNKISSLQETITTLESKCSSYTTELAQKDKLMIEK